MIGVGPQTSLVLLKSGALMAFGRNTQGQLGISGTNSACGGSQKCEFAPKSVPFTGAETIVQIAGGEGHTLVLTSAGTVYASGSNAYNQVT